jgi:subtilisin family serine protease
MQDSFPGRKLVTTHLALAFSLLVIFTLLIVAAMPPASSARQQPAQSDFSQKRARPVIVPGQVLLRYRSESAAKLQTRQTPQVILSVEGRQFSIQIERFAGSDIVPGLRLAHVDPEDTLAAIEALKQQPDVLYAEPNYRWYRTTTTPNDPCFPINSLPGCHSVDLYGLSKIGAPLAWDTIKGSSDTGQSGFGTPRIVVGVIDEGIDTTHEDLVGNIWSNPGETPGNGIDDDNNGFIDDVNGYNFFNNTGTIPAANHATHVAGIIGATGNNSTGVVGVNWQVGLMSLKFLDSNTGSTSDAIRASAYAKQMRDLWVSSGGTRGANVRVLNNSWGPDRRLGNGLSLALRDVIISVAQSGILFVVAAGNDTIDNDVDPAYPGSFNLPNLISVASTDRLDALSSFSDFGASTITMGAPGSGILSTTIGNTYSVMNGTSMAAPHVSGAAALLLAANPSLSVQQLRSLLIFNGDPLPSLAGKTLTGRRLNVGSSLQALAENDVTPPGTVTNLHLNSQSGRSLNVGWTASGDDGATGTASLYQLTFTDATSGAVVFLKSVIPVASGVTQAIDVKLPYRHTSGTLTLREFDNVGNEGVPATVAVSVSLLEGDPYLTSTGTSVPLSTGGVGLATNCDDCSKTQALPFSFPFFGENFNSVTATSNGSLYFSTPLPNDSQSSSVALVQFKMIAGLWDDLRTDRRSGDDIYVVTPDASRIIFRWQGVTFGDGTAATEFPVNFEIELRSNGTILTRYGDGNTHIFPVVGISAGEPDAYVIASHTSEQAQTSLTNAPEVTFLPRAIGITSSVQFSVPQFNVVESDGSATLTVTRSGDTSTQSAVDYLTTDGAATQKGDFIFSTGRVNFAAGETSKTFSVLIVDDVYQEGTESFSVMLTNPVNTIIGARSVAAVVIQDNDLSPPTTNPLDNADARFFVRQHYLDFLNREPDPDGLNFWTNQITSCGTDQACIEIRRINVSAAFFLSIEFQETGYLVYKMYKTAYGNLSTPAGAPVPVRYEEFLPDTQKIALGVVVGVGNWQAQLESNKVAFAAEFVSRTRFATAYPTTLTPAQFVDALIAKAGFTATPAERAAFINEFGTATTTADMAARARVVREIAENGTFSRQELNNAFVLMEYFGYLRRNPYDPPEATLDYSGYNFWLGKLNQFNGNFVNAEMVKAFIVSGEYRHRFGP